MPHGQKDTRAGRHGRHGAIFGSAPGRQRPPGHGGGTRPGRGRASEPAPSPGRCARGRRVPQPAPRGALGRDRRLPHLPDTRAGCRPAAGARRHRPLHLPLQLPHLCRRGTSCPRELPAADRRLARCRPARLRRLQHLQGARRESAPFAAAPQLDHRPAGHHLLTHALPARHARGAEHRRARLRRQAGRPAGPGEKPPGHDELGGGCREDAGRPAPPGGDSGRDL